MRQVTRMRAKHLLVVLSLLGLAACGPIWVIPKVGATVTGPATLPIGTSAQYVATVTGAGSASPTTPNGWAIDWKSSDPSVATVSDLGVVTAVLPGRTTITATPRQGSERGFSGTLMVNVTGCGPDFCSG